MAAATAVGPASGVRNHTQQLRLEDRLRLRGGKHFLPSSSLPFPSEKTAKSSQGAELRGASCGSYYCDVHRQSPAIGHQPRGGVVCVVVVRCFVHVCAWGCWYLYRALHPILHSTPKVWPKFVKCEVRSKFAAGPSPCLATHRAVGSLGSRRERGNKKRTPTRAERKVMGKADLRPPRGLTTRPGGQEQAQAWARSLSCGSVSQNCRGRGVPWHQKLRRTLLLCVNCCEWMSGPCS